MTLVTANTALPDPSGSTVVRVTSAHELRDAVLKAAPDADVVVMAAAVADFRPVTAAAHKIKRTDDDPDPIPLVRNPDVLAELVAVRRPGQLLVGFAAETGDDTGDVLAHGRMKLARKGCDLLVVNDVGSGRAFGRPDNAAVILDSDGGESPVARGPKAVLAAAVWDAVSARLGRTDDAGARRHQPLDSARIPPLNRPGASVTRRLFTSESVTEGHPDKIADQISDSILDALLAQDSKSRVAVETLITTGQVHVAGEVTTEAYADIPAIVRDRILDIGYDSSRKGFDGQSCGVSVSIGAQSPDIAQGVDAAYEARVEGSEDAVAAQGAGDQGLMFGFACDDTPELMPVPIWLAHRLAERLTAVRKGGVVPYLRPDGKTQVTIEYDGDKPVRLDTIVISSQHAEDIDLDTLLKPDIEEHVVTPVLAGLDINTNGYRLLVNPTGRFVTGGPMGDAGLTGRKIIVDTYGGYARHGGGAFSGKDPSKVDRSACYAMRWVAKNVVAARLATKVEVQVAYAIGKAEPVGLFIETFGTETADPDRIAEAISQTFDLRPAAIIRDLDLLRPIYAQTAAYGHFGRELPDFTWERTDRAEQLAKLANG